MPLSGIRVLRCSSRGSSLSVKTRYSFATWSRILLSVSSLVPSVGRMRWNVRMGTSRRMLFL